MKKEGKKNKKIIAFVLISFVIIILAVTVISLIPSNQLSGIKADSDNGCHYSWYMKFNDGKLFINYNNGTKFDVTDGHSVKTENISQDSSYYNDYGEFTVSSVRNNTDASTSYTLSISDLNNKNTTVISDDCYSSHSHKDKLYYIEGDDTLYVYNYDNKEKSKLYQFSLDSAKIKNMIVQLDKLYVMYSYFDRVDNNYVSKCFVKVFDANTLAPASEYSVNMNEMDINSQEYNTFICGNKIVFLGKDLGLLIFTYDIESGKINNLGKHKIVNADANSKGLYFTMGDYFDEETREYKENNWGLWKLDIESGEITNIDDSFKAYNDLLLTENYAYVYKKNYKFPFFIANELMDYIFGDAVYTENGYTLKQIELK